MIKPRILEEDRKPSDGQRGVGGVGRGLRGRGRWRQELLAGFLEGAKSGWGQLVWGAQVKATVSRRKDLGSGEHEPQFLSQWFYLTEEMVAGEKLRIRNTHNQGLPVTKCPGGK